MIGRMSEMWQVDNTNRVRSRFAENNGVIKIDKLIIIVIIFYFVCITFANQPYARMQTYNINTKMDISTYNKFGYLIDPIKPKLKIDDISFIDTGLFYAIRIKNEKFCIESECLGFIVQKCEEQRCPYASAFIGSEVIISSVIRSELPDVPMDSFSISSKHGSSYFIMGHGFVSVIELINDRMARELIKYRAILEKYKGVE